MRGKNTGKKTIQPSKDRSKACLQPILQKPTITTSKVPDCESDCSNVSMSKPLGDELAYFTFPVPLDGEMIFLIRRCKRL
jgi:hypothetical protein